VLEAGVQKAHGIDKQDSTPQIQTHANTFALACIVCKYVCVSLCILLAVYSVFYFESSFVCK